MKKRILIADDESTVLDSIRRYLETDYDVTGVTSCLDIVNLCLNERFDALILDNVFYDGMSGLETAALIREHDNCIRIIIMSAHDQPATRQRAISIGASFIEKPAALERIRALLED